MLKRIKNFPHFKEVFIGAGSGLLVLTLMLGGLVISSPGPDSNAASDVSAAPSASEAPPRTCTVTEEESNPSLGTLQAVVLNSETGEVLFDRDADTPAATASVMKSLTAAAVLASVGPDYQLSTRVMADPANPSRIALVGAGDITLSKTSAGAQSVYKGAPKLATLVAQVRAWASSNGVAQINEIILDSSFFPGSGWETSWQRVNQVDGWISEVTALQLDGDRVLPEAPTSARTGRPVTSAGEQFKLGLAELAPAATLIQGSAPSGFVEIAKVDSQPMSDWIANVLVSSDNSLSEALGKIATIEAGFDATYDNLDTAYERILEESGLDFSGVTVRDGSGLSDLNLVSPRFMAELMRLVDSGYGDFDVIKDSLMVAGETGSLATRFQGDLSDAAGNVRAKTGYLTKVHTLNGIIEAKDGTSLTFTIYAYGAVGSDVRVAIDTLVTSFYRCGNTLSND